MHCLFSTPKPSWMWHLYQDVSILLLLHRTPGGPPFLAIFPRLSSIYHRLTAVNRLLFPLPMTGVTSPVYLQLMTTVIYGEKNIFFEPAY